MNEKQKSILLSLEQNPKQSTSELASNTGLSIRDVQRHIRELVENNAVQVLGNTSSRVYLRVYNQEFIKKELVVFESGIQIGHLKYGDGQYEFVYHPSFRGELTGIPQNTVNKSSELFNVFENLIPEHDRRDKLLSNNNDIGDVLPLINNAHGAFEFVRADELFKFKPSRQSLPNWYTVKHKILGENVYPNVLDVNLAISDEILNDFSRKEYSNLSGYQTKIDVAYYPDLNLISLADSDANYILKPRGLGRMDYFGKDGYYPFLGLNEHLHMSFAKNELGFDVPYTAVVLAKEGNDFHYLAKRYDRYSEFKYAQKDFAQIMNIPSKQKYMPISEKLFEAVKDVISSKDAKMDALAFYYYSFLIKHADLHTKNIGILSISSQINILTPLYDVISVGIYNGRDSDDLGLKSKRRTRPKGFNLEDFKDFAKILNISWGDFKNRAKIITEKYLEKMPEYIQKTKTLEEKYQLRYQLGRNHTTTFSSRMENMFKERVIDLKKNGILEEFGLIEKAGGPLSRSKKKVRLFSKNTGEENPKEDLVVFTKI